MSNLVVEAGITVVAAPERLITCWLGGALLASIPALEELWVPRGAFETRGHAAVEEGCWLPPCLPLGALQRQMAASEGARASGRTELAARAAGCQATCHGRRTLAARGDSRLDGDSISTLV